MLIRQTLAIIQIWLTENEALKCIFLYYLAVKGNLEKQQTPVRAEKQLR